MSAVKKTQPRKPVIVVEGKPAGECNVPECQRVPVTRGVCGAHWATHRGYAVSNAKDE